MWAFGSRVFNTYYLGGLWETGWWQLTYFFEILTPNPGEMIPILTHIFLNGLIETTNQENNRRYFRAGALRNISFMIHRYCVFWYDPTLSGNSLQLKVDSATVPWLGIFLKRYFWDLSSWWFQRWENTWTTEILTRLTRIHYIGIYLGNL